MSAVSGDVTPAGLDGWVRTDIDTAPPSSWTGLLPAAEGGGESFTLASRPSRSALGIRPTRSSCSMTVDDALAGPNTGAPLTPRGRACRVRPRQSRVMAGLRRWPCAGFSSCTGRPRSARLRPDQGRGQLGEQAEPATRAGSSGMLPEIERRRRQSQSDAARASARFPRRPLPAGAAEPERDETFAGDVEHDRERWLRLHVRAAGGRGPAKGPCVPPGGAG